MEEWVVCGLEVKEVQTVQPRWAAALMTVCGIFPEIKDDADVQYLMKPVFMMWFL